MRQVLLVCPQERDFREIDLAGLGGEFEVLTAGSDLDVHDDAFDAEQFVADHSARAVDGAVGTKDRSALLAALIAERASLGGPTPRALLACQHKPTSRVLQRDAAPESVPRFALLNGSVPPSTLTTPFFVKPVVGRLSENARRVDSLAMLDDLAEDGYPPRYARIAALAGLPEADVHGFLAEELLAGAEVTLEGYVHRGRVTTIGVTDSLKYPGTNSFECFAFPSALPAERLEELARLAARVLPAHGFDDGFFNMELFLPESGPAKLIEVNGRIASQFAPLVRAVQGRSTYEALFRLACGDDPEWHETPRARRRHQLLPARLRGRVRRGRARAGRRRRDPRRAGHAPVGAGDERRRELPAGHLPRMGRDEGGGARALPDARRLAGLRPRAFDASPRGGPR